METEQIQNPANLIFIGFMFMGIAIGLLFNVVAAGSLLGMGTGFIARVLLTSFGRNKHKKSENNINTL